MNSDPQYTDEEIQGLLRQIKADQKPVPPSDKAPAQAKPVEAAARPADIMRELSIDEILKKMEREISGKTAPVIDRTRG